MSEVAAKLARFSEEEINAAIRADPLIWFEVYGRIIDKAGQLVTPVANEYQRKIVEIYLWCLLHKVPCRIVALKPRQKGSTTITVALGYVHLRNSVGSGIFVGNKAKTTANMVTMFERYHANDEFQGWGNRGRVTSEGAVFSHDSKLLCETAGGQDIGRSGTFQFALLTELAFWQGEGKRSPENTLNGLQNCVPYLPGTVIIKESTANGAAGVFYEGYTQGITFEELKAGKRGYVKVFSPWFEFADSEDPLTPEESEKVVASYTEEEAEAVEQYGLRPGHVAFWRRVQRDECEGDLDRFRQEYPFDDESAFLLSGRQRFNKAGLSVLAARAKAAPWEDGCLEIQKSGRVVFRPTDENEALVRILELPQPHRRYLVSADAMTGEQSAGKKPDTHSVFVLRAPYVSDGGRRVRGATVARIRPECRWDIDVLALEIVKLARFYGNCLVVPEANGPGLALINELKSYGVSIFRRREVDKLTNKPTDYLGWQTKDGASRTGNRSMIIERLAKAIRDYDTDDGLDLLCPHAIKQARKFIVNERGKAEAASGALDDDVLSIAIGWYCIDGATPFLEPVVERYIPRDLRAHYETRTGSAYS